MPTAPNKSHLECFLRYLWQSLRDDECHFFGCYRAHTDFKLNRIQSHPEGFNWTIGGYFDKWDHVRYECCRLHKVNAYVSVNPLSRDKMRISSNKTAVIKSGNGANDVDVTVLRHLFIDIDPVKPKSHKDGSATQEEMQAAITLRDRIIAEHGNRMDLHNSGLWGRSGNGAWILARLPEYRNDERHRKIVHGVLRSLASRYDGPLARVDTATYNPARVMCAVGTVKCKGTPTVDRPWRLSTVDGGSAMPTV